jgi:type VI secretion system protein VasD
MTLSHHIRWSVATLLVSVMIFGVGCQKTRKVLKVNTSAEIEFIVSSAVNPDDDNRASPLVVSIVKLRDSRQFEREDLLSLYEQPEQRLGTDYLGIIRLKELAPGEQRTESFELEDDVQYLGLIAEYSRYETATAILALPITANKNNKYEVSAEASGLKLE